MPAGGDDSVLVMFGSQALLGMQQEPFAAVFGQPMHVPCRAATLPGAGLGSAAPGAWVSCGLPDGGVFSRLFEARRAAFQGGYFSEVCVIALFVVFEGKQPTLPF